MALHGIKDFIREVQYTMVPSMEQVGHLIVDALKWNIRSHFCSWYCCYSNNAEAVVTQQKLLWLSQWMSSTITRIGKIIMKQESFYVFLLLMILGTISIIKSNNTVITSTKCSEYFITIWIIFEIIRSVVLSSRDLK